MKLEGKETEYVWDVLRCLLAAGHDARANGEPFPLTAAGTLDGTAARQALDYVWEHREVIDLVLARSKDPTKRMLLRRWKEQALFGWFMLYEIEGEDALIGGLVQETSIWRVRAMSCPWEDMTAHLPLPLLFQGALLPVGNSVIADGIMAVHKVPHSPDAVQPLLDRFRLAKEHGTIRSSFPPYGASSSTHRTGVINKKKKGKRK